MKVNDILGCFGWAGAFVAASVLIPLAGPIISLLTPLPFLYYSTKLGLLEGIKVAGVTVLLLGIVAWLTGHIQVIVFCMEFSLLGLLLSELFRRGLSLGQTIFIATAFLLVLGFAVLFSLAQTRDMGPIEMTLGYLKAHMDATVSAYEKTGLSDEQILELKAYSKAFMETISKIYPVLTIIGTGLAVWINVISAKVLFRMRNLTYPDYGPMDRWQSPEKLVWGLIVSGFALFFTSGSIKLLAINTLIILMAIYFFHGLSIVLFFLNKYRVPSWIRVGVYFIIIIQKLFILMSALAGIFDQWIDFRKIHRRMQS